MIDISTPDLYVSPVVSISKKRGRPRKAEGAKSDAERQAASRERKRIEKEISEDVRTPSEREPEFPTLTGDQPTDQKVKCDYERELKVFRKQWSDFLDKDPELHQDRGRFIPGAGELVSGGWDAEKIRGVSAAAIRRTNGGPSRQGGHGPDE